MTLIGEIQQQQRFGGVIDTAAHPPTRSSMYEAAVQIKEATAAPSGATLYSVPGVVVSGANPWGRSNYRMSDLPVGPSADTYYLELAKRIALVGPKKSGTSSTCDLIIFDPEGGVTAVQIKNSKLMIEGPKLFEGLSALWGEALFASGETFFATRAYEEIGKLLNRRQGWSAAFRELHSLTKLPQNWDGRGAGPLATTTTNELERTLRKWIDSIPAPRFMLGPNADAWAIWGMHDLSIEICFQSPTEVFSMVDDARGIIEEFEDDDASFEKTANALEELARRTAAARLT